jgi:hypothetical protein
MTSQFPPPEVPDQGSTPPPAPPAPPAPAAPPAPPAMPAQPPAAQPPAAPPPPPAPAAYGQPAAATPYQMPRQSSGKATTAMVLGIVGLVACGIAGIVAIVLGNQAKNEIDASGGQLEGRGMALAGIIMGWIAVGIMVLGVAIFLLIVIVGASSSSG